MSKVVTKIDDYLEEKYQKNILGQEMKWLYATEDVVLDADQKKRILEGMIGGKGYEAFYKKTLKKYKAKTAKDLSDDDKKKFFDEIDKGWKAKKETD